MNDPGLGPSAPRPALSVMVFVNVAESSQLKSILRQSKSPFQEQAFVLLPYPHKEVRGPSIYHPQ